jgi:uncharacterized protein YhdP
MTPALKATSRRNLLRFGLLGGAGVIAVMAFVLFAYELALAQVPEHRAALERLVRAETGLDVRFSELGLRWGWYGPEAVFREVELDEPGTKESLLRAPELVVGFDAWRTLRSGHPEAGRIELVSPDIDFAGSAVRGVGEVSRALANAASDARAAMAGRTGNATGPAIGAQASTLSPLGLNRVALLQRWRGGRIDIDGGTLHLPDPAGGANAFMLQLQRATLRRSDSEWSVFGLVLLPDAVGRTARIVLHVNGDLAKPDGLNGSLKLEARRLLFPGCRDLLAGIPDLAQYLPRGGNGDVTFDLDFEGGRIVKAGGNIRASRLVFDAPGHTNTLELNRLRGDWRVARRGTGWRLKVDSLELAKGAQPASLTIDTGESDSVAQGRWARGTLEQAPVESVLAVARWLSPGLDLAGIELDGTARNVTFDWLSGRPQGKRLQASARLSDVSLEPQSHDFTLSGLDVRVAGDETEMTADVQSHGARLELAQSRQYPLGNVHVSSTLTLASTASGWRIATDRFLLEHQHATLSLSGELRGPLDSEPEIIARGTLTGADIPFIERLLGANTAEAFGAVASRLTAGRIQNAQFELRGPISELPFGGRGGFTGSLTLKDAVLSGGDLWPDAKGIDARIEWHGARIQANIDTGHAGPFELAAASAQWDADGQAATRLTGNINGRLEEAIAWIHDHPRLQDFTPDLKDLDASGNASFYFNVSVPPGPDDAVHEPAVAARVSTVLDGARLSAVSGLPPMQGIKGSFVFDAGHVQKTTLTGTWLGGPVTLRLSERRERGVRVFAVQGQGSLNAQRLAALANATGTVQGNTDWNGELVYIPTTDQQPAHWRMRADSNLVGLVSSLPEPLAKRAAMAVPVHMDLTGTDEAAQLRVALGDRARGVFALKRRPDVVWTVSRGALRFGAAAVTLPGEPVLTVQGRINQLDLPAYVAAWQRLRQDSLPTIRARISAGRLLVGGRIYDEVALQAERTSTTNELRVESAQLAGTASWPAATQVQHPAPDGPPQPARLRLARLDLPDDTLPDASAALIAGLAPTALVSIDDLRWGGRSLGRLTATVAAQNNILAVEDIHLVSATHDAGGTLHCQTDSPDCVLNFRVESRDAAATLEDFGFSPDLAAEAGSLTGDVEWQPAAGQSWLASLRGTLSLKLSTGMLLANTEQAPGHAPFGLLAVPALVGGLSELNTAGSALDRAYGDLRFASLEADFDVREGQATTSNLHFDGDAEILMRGRTGLVSRDYDQQVWVLRGEERLPAAVRRFGATPRVAAVWLSLRDLLAGGGDSDRSAAVWRLQGSWNAPIVVAAK